jgi:hypothetical protein
MRDEDADAFWAPDSPDRRPVVRLAALSGCLALLGGVILVLVHPGLSPLHVQPVPLAVVAWAAFAAAAWRLRKVTVKLAVGLILAGGIALQVAAISAPPADSTDSYRYIWDGRVQAAGIDPYLYPPAAAGVAQLRNDFLWPPVPADRLHLCPHARASKQGAAFDLVAGCAKIGRLSVPTIYPPVAEAYFLAVQLAAPADDSSLPIQAAGAACAMLTTLVLLLGLRRLGRDVRLAALWAWCPTTVLEAGNNAHVDVLAVLLTAISLLVLARARTEGKAMLGGALLGLAIATKMTPVLVVPGVLRRAWQHIAVAATAAIVVVYMPHLMAVGSRVIGFLPGYLHEQGYSTGTGFDIIGLAVPGKLAAVVAVALLGAVALAILRFGDPGQPWRGGVLMTAAALVICTPQFQWYAMLLVMLIALDGRPEWLALVAGGYLGNHMRLTATVLIPHAPVMGYAGGAAIAGALALARHFSLGDGHQSPRPPTSAASRRTPRCAGQAPRNHRDPARLARPLEAALAGSLRLTKTGVSIPWGMPANPPGAPSVGTPGCAGEAPRNRRDPARLARTAQVLARWRSLRRAENRGRQSLLGRGRQSLLGIGANPPGSQPAGVPAAQDRPAVADGSRRSVASPSEAGANARTPLITIGADGAPAFGSPDGSQG